MNVLLVSNIFPNSVEKERGIFTYQIALALSRWCRIQVIAPLPWVPPPLRNSKISRYAHAHVPFQESIGGLTIFHPRYGVIPKVLGFMHPVFMFWPLMSLIKRLNRVKPFDIINAHWIFPDGIATAWAGRRVKKPVVLTALGCDINYYPTLPFRKRFIKHATNLADLLTVKGNSLGEAALGLQIPKEKVVVIPNGVDLNLFHIMNRKKVRKKLGISDHRLIVLTVGTQDEVKGTKYLIEAVALIKEKTDFPILLVCIGEGPLRNRLISKARDLSIQDDVTFANNKGHEEIPLWMNAADVFCLPSLREGHPNVVLESLACGIPVVASKVGSIPELIADHNGRLCRVADPESLCEQLIASLKVDWDRKSIRKTVEDRDWAHCAREYHEVYIEAMKMHLKRNSC